MDAVSAFLDFWSLALTPPIPTVEPTTLYAGDTAKWSKHLPDFPATDGWALVYAFRGPTALDDQTASASGADFAVTIPASATVGLQPGTYSWVARASKAGETYTAAHGVFTVLAAVGAVVADHDETTLEVIKAAIAGRLTADMQAYTINGRSVTKIPIAELIGLRGQYERRVWRKRNPTRASTQRLVRFGGAS